MSLPSLFKWQEWQLSGWRAFTVTLNFEWMVSDKIQQNSVWQRFEIPEWKWPCAAFREWSTGLMPFNPIGRHLTIVKSQNWLAVANFLHRSSTDVGDPALDHSPSITLHFWGDHTPAQPVDGNISGSDWLWLWIDRTGKFEYAVQHWSIYRVVYRRRGKEKDFERFIEQKWISVDMLERAKRENILQRTKEGQRG